MTKRKPLRRVKSVPQLGCLKKVLGTIHRTPSGFSLLGTGDLKTMQTVNTYPLLNEVRTQLGQWKCTRPFFVWGAHTKSDNAPARK